MEPITMISTAAMALLSGATASIVSGRVAARREQQQASENLQRAQDDARKQRERLELRLSHAQSENELLRRLCMIEGVPSAPPPRPRRVDLDAIVARLRGLSFLDAAVIADRVGLPLTGHPEPRDHELATVASALFEAQSSLGALGVSPGEIQAVTRHALHVTARPLPAWTGGAWLLASATSQPPNPLGISAAAALAMLRSPTAPTPERASLTGTTLRVGERSARSQSLLDELVRVARGSGATLALLAQGSTPMLAIHDDGPTTETAAGFLSALETLRKRLGARLRQPVELVSVSAPGARLHLSMVGSSLRLLLAGPSATLDPLELQRLVGRVKRLSAEGPQSSHSTAP